MRHRATGILFVLSGTCFLAGVLDPPILPTWGGSAADLMAAASAHRAAWFASTWLITLSIAVGLAAVELRSWRLPPELLASVVAQHPRLGFKREFSAAFRTEAARVPHGRARFLRRYGAFDLAIKLAPFTG